MATVNQEEEMEESEDLDSYLSDPKTFHLETPLYKEFDLTNPEVRERAYELMSDTDTIDAYCIWCAKDNTVFNCKINIHSTRYTPQVEWTTNEGIVELIQYRCTRDHGHIYRSYYLKEAATLTKIGQYPSVATFQIPQAAQYRKILGEEQYKELTRGIGLAANGVGIGSFVYLRRIFENLIEEAHALASKAEEFSEEKYSKARMDERIQLLSDYLPEFLVENRSLYGILSNGIHELSEEECLTYFHPVRIGIEQILDEKIEQEKKRKKAEEARKKIHGVTQAIASKNSSTPPA